VLACVLAIDMDAALKSRSYWAVEFLRALYQLRQEYGDDQND